ncbi:unnamed protein product [Adineta ricciae]|uniref:Poly [ADP-ribose] polymerase n=1 Tax=Adineta ricciae TaxID=249248 RepID=A0A815XZ41_ADIRI|nr:unnamed protein product [Adineta ricciae]
MPEVNNTRELEECLTKLIETVDKSIKEMNKYKEQLQDKSIDESSSIGEDSRTFTLNDEENECLVTLTSNIQTILEQSLPKLSRESSQYLIDSLHAYTYDSEKKLFKSPLSIELLNPLHQELQGLLASIEAYPAALNGEIDKVKGFIDQHPRYRNKPGLWQTTMLYSAAKSNHFDIVKYLIEEAHCSVNAQNQRDMAFALGADLKDYSPRPAAGSTALHAACFNNHLRIVKYLVQHGADYFSHNQAHETPIENGLNHPEIKKFFQEYLLLHYSMNDSDQLPIYPILDESQRPRRDCMWEYKPFQDTNWYKFSAPEATELHKNLLPSEKFQKQVYLNVKKGLYTVSFMEFCRSGRHSQDPQKNMAWVRCRGSSILNFDCVPLWQIMVIRFDKADSIETDTTTSLKVQQFPPMDDKCFKLHLNTWYSCVEAVSRSLDEAMNYRRRVIQANFPHIGDQLVVNLETFQFANKDKTITGYIRWIPKLVSNDDSDEKKIVIVDNYQPKATDDPVPLTIERLEKVSKSRQKRSKKTAINMDDEGDTSDHENDESSIDMAASLQFSNDDYNGDDDDDDTEFGVNYGITDDDNNGTWSLSDLTDTTVSTNSTSMSSGSATSTTTTSPVDEESTAVSAEQFLKKAIENMKPAVLVERENSLLREEEANKIREHLALELQDLRNQIEQEKLRAEQFKQTQKKLSKEKDVQLQQTNEKLAQLQRQLDTKEAREQKLQHLSKQIKAVDYDDIDALLVKLFLAPNQKLVVIHLQSKYKLDRYFVGIPAMTMTEKATSYCVSLTGVQAHHDEFRLILRRLKILFTLVQSTKTYYRQQLDRTVSSIHRIMTQSVQTSTNWRYYTRYFQESVQQKIEEFAHAFDEYISHESKNMIEQSITDAAFRPSSQLLKLSARYTKRRQLLPELEILKVQALNEFVKQQILSERTKFEKKPSGTSIQTLNQFIDQAKKEFQTDTKYHGFELAQLKHIPKLLHRIMLYYRCFLLQLPLYDASKELLAKIQRSTVVTIATSTGSGKSSLLPALLIAEGYDKVIVTQPRRLPCRAICDRVNQTMMGNNRTFKIAGWAVSGEEYSTNSPILYLTDGLLKERLLHDEQLITEKTKVNKSIVFFIDEVHERSVNIDLCLASIARLLNKKPQLKSKIKIIISSATLDTSVPTLFTNIPQLKFDQFQMTNLGTLYHVTKISRPNQNILDLVQELCKKRQRHDQILCFVSSVSEVHQCCKLLHEISRQTLVAYPLIQAQSANEQQDFIEHGSIFFSTTVAETSLTFPSLTYVIDTGMVNVPVYDFNTKQTTLQEVRAAESTIKQRLGRLGRTKPGEYYALYDFKVEEKRFPTPQICQSELSNVEFSLRRSLIKQGLHYMKKFLPDSPSPQAINAAIHELKQLNILNAQENLTQIGIGISRLPDFGSLAMSKAVLSALDKYNCGYDLIVLSSILGVLNTSSILKDLPDRMKRPEGDFMSVLVAMYEVLLVRESVPSSQFKLHKVCQAKQLDKITHVIRHALKRYDNLERAFKRSTEYRTKAFIFSGDWSLIARALIDGYGDNVFVSMKELQGKTHLFTRYTSAGKEDFAVLDLQSTLTRSISAAPVALILARDVRFSSSVRSTAVLSFVGEIYSQWINDQRINRKITLNIAEESTLISNSILALVQQIYPQVVAQLNNHVLLLVGKAGQVLQAELFVLRQLIVEMKFQLRNPYLPSASADHKRMARNLESVSNMTWIFRPMIWRWEAQRQVKIHVAKSFLKDESEVTITGRDSQNQLIYNEFQSFLGWLKVCAVIRHPNAGVSPRILKPQMRKNCLDIEEKISHVTDSKRTSIDLWKSLKGSKATRETRMEVVAWIAVTQFECRLEGGFIRDWIVGNYIGRPSTDPSTWVTFNTNKAGVKVPYLDKSLIPSDLDCHLPSDKYFDIDKFLDHLHRYQIECEVVREDWRYVLLFDKTAKTGAFTMDLIEPHVALTHDRIDFDVSNLSLEKNYTKELGMRVDIQQKPYSIDIEAIVDNIKNKRFQVLRPIDGQIQMRIQKMQSRGWTQLGEAMLIVPDPPPKYHAILVPLPENTCLYQHIVQQMKVHIGNQANIKSIEQIRNPSIEDMYLSMKQIIAKQCPGRNPNEKELFHGTKSIAIDGILNDGYDDRYWGTNFGSGKFGHGAYFADNPSVSHRYTESNPSDQTRIMYFNKVVLGKEFILTTTNSNLVSAPKDHHSVHAIFSGLPYSDEYIVYRYGQAMPYLKIIYIA